MSALMRASLTAFNATLAAFAARSKVDLVTLQRITCIQILTGVVQKTPVDLGRARGGWQVDTGVRRTEPSIDRNGAATIANGVDALSTIRFGTTTQIFNNVEYITYLNEGSSAQAPAHFVEQTVAEVQAQFE